MSNTPWNADKAARNLEKHEISFELADAFEWDTALFTIDVRKDYGEVRYVAIGFIGVRLYTLVFTIRDGRAWLISLRKSHKKEAQHYAKSLEA